ncbi:MAG: DUF4349 domain-containing protein [Fimbriimonadaceae bacterium]|nr:DUF4349 domain-containing protein [Chitinophagales bacterium]
MKFTSILFACLTIFVAACSTNSQEQNSDEEQFKSIITPVSQSQSAVESEEANYNLQRKIIKEGEVAFQTSDIIATEKFIKETITKVNGYIGSENIREVSERKEHVITVKVPAKNFDTFLSAISSNAGEFDKKNITTKDVTEDFIDTEARIKAMQTVEARYFELLKQAKNIEEMLKVEAELTNVRQQIESAQGHINYLTDKTSFSSLTIIFYPPPVVLAELKVITFGEKFKHGLQNGWQIILSILIGLANIWPLLLIGSSIAFLLYFQQKKRKFVRI